MAYEFWISANKLVWPARCAKCMGEPNTRVLVSTKKITSSNLLEASFEVPYCTAREQADRTRSLRFGWFKSFFETFIEHVHAVEYLKLHNSAHFFRFESKEYLELFLQSNGGKRRSEVVMK